VAVLAHPWRASVRGDPDAFDPAPCLERPTDAVELSPAEALEVLLLAGADDDV